MLRIGVITILPEMFDTLKYGVVGRAIGQDVAQITCWNPRDWAVNEHRQIDDRPYGGGPGMVMMYAPLHAAIMQAKQQLPGCKTVYLSPQGQKVEQEKLNRIVETRCPILFIAGRYEGIDERVILHDVDEEWSIGDFVLSGGEFAAMIFIDAIVRLLPGSLGHPGSATADSFMHGLLDHPQYTRPAEVNGTAVPSVLLSGSHQLIARWQRKQALGQTWLKRPDLLKSADLNETDKRLLAEFQLEQNNEE